jgi:hypothetical protein
LPRYAAGYTPQAGHPALSGFGLTGKDFWFGYNNNNRNAGYKAIRLVWQKSGIRVLYSSLPGNINWL